MGSLRDLHAVHAHFSSPGNPEEQSFPSILSEEEFDEISRWIWKTILPTAPYCDVSNEDKKKYDRIKELLRHLLREEI
jgi:hypothetical protein